MAPVRSDRLVAAALATLGTAILLGLPAMPARAQLSPGPLHAVHARLEGLRQCLRCHDSDGAMDRKCLDCHRALADRIAAGRGWHGRLHPADCAGCHVEHNGRDVPLVHWDPPRDRFAHAATGFVLAGRHAELECRQCHRPDLVRDETVRRAKGDRLDRTYLGLGTACADCHRDPHRGQMHRGCEECHNQRQWRPASRFDHDRSGFPLTGRHRQVACARCHAPTVPADGDTLVRYTGIEHGACLDCHRDPHRPSLGDDCNRCHTTDGWTEVRRGTFDHDRTAFPLRGSHARLECRACHREGRPLSPLPHRRCVDCHRDPHPRPPDRPDRYTACTGCHDQRRWSPTTFTVQQHALTRFPLAGAHLALPCLACHRRDPAAGPRAPLPLHRDRVDCRSCHANPHGAVLDSLLAGGGCRTCHVQDDWRTVAFAHDDTRFPLTGRHAAVACRRCHLPAETVSPGTPAVDFRALETSCAACHEDVHRGQFEPAAGGIRCDRCHVTTDWLAERFDHDRDTRFPLTGRHAAVACRGCHPRQAGTDRPGLLTYRPTPTDCAACHGGAETGSIPGSRP